MDNLMSAFRYNKRMVIESLGKSKRKKNTLIRYWEEASKRNENLS